MRPLRRSRYTSTTWLILGGVAAAVQGCGALFGLEELEVGGKDAGADSTNPIDSTVVRDTSAAMDSAGDVETSNVGFLPDGAEPLGNAGDVADSGAREDASADAPLHDADTQPERASDVAVGSEADAPIDVAPQGRDDHADTDVLQRGMSGRQDIHWVTKNGIVDVPADLSAVTFEALVPRANDSGFDVYPGMGYREGTFTIPDVPAGTYYLHVGNSHTVTAARFVDLSYYRTGRPDGEVAGEGTILNFNLSNLNDWQSTDELQLISSNAGVVILGLARDASQGSPAPGATEVKGMRYDYSLAPNPILLDATKGDELMLTQLTTRTVDGGPTYQAIDRVYFESTFTFKSGVSNEVLGPFFPEPHSMSLKTTWKHGDFAQYTAATSPSATYSSQYLAVDGIAGGLAHGETADPGGFPDLLLYASDAMSDEVLNLSYQNPFPSSYGLFGRVGFMSQVAISLPLPDGGDGLPFQMPATIVGDTDVTNFNNSTITAAVSPIRNPLVDGKDGFSQVSGITTTPTITWNAPARGIPSQYVVTLWEVFLNGDQTALKGKRRFATTQTQLRIPPRVFEAGRHYLVRIQAFVGAFDPEVHPSIWPLPAGQADAILGLVSP